MRIVKTRQIESFYKKPWGDLLGEFYERNNFSSNQIAEKIKKDSGIVLTPRWIQVYLCRLGLTRSRSDARFVAIRTGRVDYNHLKKPVKSKELRRSISLPIRYAIMKRDNFRCVLCGCDASGTRLVIDHVIPVVRRGTSDETNLRTLCWACNHGKMIHEKEK